MTKTLLSFKDYGFIRQVVLHVLQMFFLVVGTLAHASKQNEVLTYGLELLAMDRRLCLKNCRINRSREMDQWVCLFFKSTKSFILFWLFSAKSFIFFCKLAKDHQFTYISKDNEKLLSILERSHIRFISYIRHCIMRLIFGLVLVSSFDPDHRDNHRNPLWF